MERWRNYKKYRGVFFAVDAGTLSVCTPVNPSPNGLLFAVIWGGMGLLELGTK